jgi:2,5-diketo-D-gluconate reductase A
MYGNERETGRAVTGAGPSGSAMGPLRRGQLLTDPTITAVAGGCWPNACPGVDSVAYPAGYYRDPQVGGPTRMASNFDVFDFELSSDMSSISMAETGSALMYEPSTLQAGE